MPRPKDEELLRHWRITKQGKEAVNGYSKYDRVCCKYCDTEFQRNTTRCRDHSAICDGAPEDVREHFSQARENGKNRTSSSTVRRSKKRAAYDDSTDSSDGELDKSIMDTISKLDVSKPAPQSGRSGGVADDAMSLLSNLLGMGTTSSTSKKPKEKSFSKYTDEELIREERELSVREKRLKVKHLELRNDLYERLMPASERVGPVLDLFERFLLQGGALIEGMLEKQNQGMTANGVYPDGTAPNVELVYGNHS